eukprot:12883071-Prorocentrum_lima.AAC.1
MCIRDREKPQDVMLPPPQRRPLTWRGNWWNLSASALVPPTQRASMRSWMCASRPPSSSTSRLALRRHDWR